MAEEINKVEDENNLTDLEKKHLPIITIPDKISSGEPFQIEIEVGKLLAHPNEEAHFIQWVELYADNILVAKVDLTPVLSSPKISITLTLNGKTTLKGLGHCNLHGTWEYKKEVLS